jgi:hypothetical protein
MKTKAVLIALGFFALFATATAQPQGMHARPGHNPEAREALKSYVQQNVLPVVSEQRDKLDANLSRQEQKELDEIRTDLKALRKEQMAHRKAMREQFGEGERPDETTREAMREKHYAAQKEHRLLMTRAWAIADAHESEIKQLLEELKPQAETWREEMKEVMAPYRPEMPEGKGERAGKGRRGGPGHPGMRGQGPSGTGPGGPGMHMMQSPVRFLLFDGELPMEEEGLRRVRVFPNPASQSNQIDFSLEKAGNVQITILDKNGGLVKTVLRDQLEAGSHSQTIDLSDLEPGLYFFKVKTPEGTISRKVIVE